MPEVQYACLWTMSNQRCARPPEGTTPSMTVPWCLNIAPKEGSRKGLGPKPVLQTVARSSGEPLIHLVQPLSVPISSRGGDNICRPSIPL